ncbi:MAG: type II toxin-antitoxin system death-on-curing family toxin [Rhodanobacteraceae bacterium]|nr:type II toxin-antitoxin system death-on-curing family toxin [Rhodanobacteraceae bacterium]
MAWVWVHAEALILLHDESLAEHGGAAGIRDRGLFESALARPVNLALYEHPDVFDLAASYAHGLAKNHPFVDGNKRCAFLAAGLFLAMNGTRLAASQVDATTTMLALAAGDIDEASYAAWLRAHSRPRERR